MCVGNAAAKSLCERQRTERTELLENRWRQRLLSRQRASLQWTALNGTHTAWFGQSPSADRLRAFKLHSGNPENVPIDWQSVCRSSRRLSSEAAQPFQA